MTVSAPSVCKTCDGTGFVRTGHINSGHVDDCPDCTCPCCGTPTIDGGLCANCWRADETDDDRAAVRRADL